MSKKALIVRGGWDGHQPMEVSGVFKKILEQEGFSIDISDTLDSFADEQYLAGLDLIIPLWTMGEIKEEYVDHVSKAVAGGVGLAGCHGGMCDAFRQSVHWQFMTGSQWVAHPGNDGTEYTVNIKKSGSSELIKGINDFKVKSEQYYIHVDPAVNVLATTRFPVVDGNHASNGQVDVPVAYTKMWGSGKVYYNSLGHHADIFDIPEAREMMRRGFLWASK